MTLAPPLLPFAFDAKRHRDGSVSILQVFRKQRNRIMCTYKDIEQVELPNGKTVKESNEAMRREIGKIYLEAWKQGVSVPFFDNDGNIYLANPDGSEDHVQLDRKTRTYQVIRRTAQPGEGRYSYLIAR